MIFFVLFVLGLAIGSFLNVVSLRYDGNRFVLDPRVIGGRSHCPSCGRTLRWFELIPIVSFFIQGGRCRRCNVRISIQHPIVELVSGLLFVLVPWRVAGFATPGPLAWLPSLLWILALLTLLLTSVIDIRKGIIPDELSVALGFLAVLLGVFLALLPHGNGSLTGPFGELFSISGNVLVGRVIGGVFGFLFFELLLLVTRGRGIGMGDVKLALPIGFLFGWPDILPVVGFAFVAGALVGILLIFLKKKTMRGTLPFGPFLAFGSALVFFLGTPIAQWYFRVMGL